MAESCVYTHTHQYRYNPAYRIKGIARDSEGACPSLEIVLTGTR